MFSEGLPLASRMELKCLPPGVTLMAKMSMQGGSHGPADKRRKGKKEQDKLPKEIMGTGRFCRSCGRKKSAQWATAYRQAKERSELTYQETRELMDARSRPLGDMSFTEFNKAWQGKMSETDLRRPSTKRTSIGRK